MDKRGHVLVKSQNRKWVEVGRFSTRRGAIRTGQHLRDADDVMGGRGVFGIKMAWDAPDMAPLPLPYKRRDPRRRTIGLKRPEHPAE